MLSNLLPGDKKDLDIYNISTYLLICGIITNQFTYTKSQCKKRYGSNVVDIIFSLDGIGLIDLPKTWGVGAIGPPLPHYSGISAIVYTAFFLI